MKRRYFRTDALCHVYQRAANKGIIFYSELDYLMFLTILGVTAEKFNVRIISICLMVDHIHLLIEAESFKDLYGFIQEYTSRFALEFNYSISRSGSLWQRPYGMALKKTDKAKRTAIAYVNNNGVEKNLAIKTEEYRWNLLKYYKNPFPFSEPIKVHGTMTKALTLVKLHHDLSKPLGYPLLVKIFSKLNPAEKEYLTDYIISAYNVIDYKAMISYYGDYNSLLMAMNSNTGSEYDLHEEFQQGSDNVYPQITAYLTEYYSIINPRTIIMKDIEEKQKIFNEIKKLGIASEYQIKKYLHLPLK